MKTNEIILLFISFLLSIDSFSQPYYRAHIPPSPPGQNLHTHGPMTEFDADRIADDFGPRRLRRGDPGSYTYVHYNWHGGIDYNSADGGEDLGDLILSVEAGNISMYSIMDDAQYSKVIQIEGNHILRYVHVFRNGTIDEQPAEGTGGCLLLYMDFPNSTEWCIVVRDNGNYKAFGPPTVMQGMVSFLDENNVVQEVTVNTSVLINEGFAPIGDSRNSNPHLHLELSSDTDDNGQPIHPGDDHYAKDPLQLYGHSVPTYNVDVFQEDDVSTGVVLSYPGTNEGTIQVHVELDGQTDQTNRYPVTMNVDNVDIKIKNFYEPGASFDHIVGPFYKSHFSHGARLGTNGTMPFTIPNEHVGDYHRTHMQPFAYATIGNMHHPRDDYYFADFATRIHTLDPMDDNPANNLFAECPQDARYNDGLYDIQTVITDVGGTVTTYPHDDFIIDNFKPFIQHVTMSYTLQEPLTYFYDEKWECNGVGSCMNFTNGNYFHLVTYEQLLSGLHVTATASEPLNSLTLSIQEFGITNLNPQSIDHQTVFHFFINGWDIQDNGSEVVMEFNGTDLSMNSLIAFDQSHSSDCIFVPTRESSSSWIDENDPDLIYGTDKLHRFSYSCGGREVLSGTTLVIESYELDIDEEITPAFTQGCPDGAIDLQILTGVPPYELQWYLDASPYGDVVYTTGSDGLEDLNNIAPGTYTVQINDALCGSAFKTYKVEVINGVINIDHVKNVSSCTENAHDYYTSQDGAIFITINYGSNYTVDWSGIGFSSSNEDINGLCPGNYVLTVTNNIGCSISEIVNICCCSLFIDPNLNEKDNSRSSDCDLVYQELEGFPDCGIVAGQEIQILEGQWYSPYDGCNGYISPQVLEMSPGAYYLWELPNGGTSNSAGLSGLCQGTYCLTVSDGCSSDSYCWVLANCEDRELEFNASVSPSCGSDGTITLNPTINDPQATLEDYIWDNGMFGSEITGLAPGQYCVTIGDVNHCYYSECFNVEVAVKYEQYRGECKFVTVCNGNDISTRFGSIDRSLNPNDCHEIFRICYDPTLPNGQDQLASTYTDPYYILGPQDPNNPYGCPSILEYCLGLNEVWDGPSEDIFVFEHFANTFNYVEAFSLPNTFDCGNCWRAKECIYNPLLDLEFPNPIVEPEEFWEIAVCDEELGSLCPPDKYCILKAFCFLESNTNNNDFWFETGCVSSAVCTYTESQMEDYLDICTNPPAPGEYRSIGINSENDNYIATENSDNFRYAINNDLLVFPNPFHDILTVETLTKTESTTLVAISTLDGRDVFYKKLNYTDGFLTLSLGHLNPGTYILNITESESFVYNTLIVKL